LPAVPIFGRPHDITKESTVHTYKRWTASVAAVACTATLGVSATAGAAVLDPTTTDTTTALVAPDPSALGVALDLSSATLRRGSKITATASVTNRTNAEQSVLADVTVTAPSGATLLDRAVTVDLAAGATQSASATYPIVGALAPGTYTVTLTATGPNGMVTTTATFTVV
jgi:hypothetical protein